MITIVIQTRVDEIGITRVDGRGIPITHVLYDLPIITECTAPISTRNNRDVLSVELVHLVSKRHGKTGTASSVGETEWINRWNDLTSLSHLCDMWIRISSWTVTNGVCASGIRLTCNHVDDRGAQACRIHIEIGSRRLRSGRRISCA